MLPKVNEAWKPLIEALAFAIKAGVFVFAITALNASNLSDLSEVKSGGQAVIVAGLIRYFSAYLPKVFQI